MNRRGLMRERWAIPLIGFVGLGAGILIGVLASGDDGDAKTTTTTVVSTATSGGNAGRNAGRKGTRTARGGAKPRVRTVVRTQTVTVPGQAGGVVSVPRSGRTFSGRNGREFGTLKVPTNMTLEWTNKGDVFTVLSERQIHVSSNNSSGRTKLFRGSYSQFRVAAIGRWTMRLTPR
jgi:hypothetical protein